MKLYEKIRKVREFNDLSQENVATRLGISQSAFSKRETGQTRLTLAQLQSVADVLAINPLDLIDLCERAFYPNGTGGPVDTPVELPAPERQVYEVRIQELREALNWQRQQNECLTNRLMQSNSGITTPARPAQI